MKKIFRSADIYLQQSSWKDLALVKFCLFSVGLLCGSFVAGKHKKPVRRCAAVIFIATYIPLMAKYLPVLKAELEKNEEYETAQDQ